MRRIAVVLLILLGGAAIWIQQSESENSKKIANSPKTESSEEGLIVARENTSDSTKVFNEKNPVVRRASKRKREHDNGVYPYTIRLSDKKQREGESDSDYRNRSYWYKSYEEYLEQENLTPNQKELLMQVLADIQMEATYSVKVFGDQLYDSSVRNIKDMVSFNDIDIALKNQLSTQLKEFLTPKQVIAFRRKSVSKSPFGYGLFQPLDIQKRSIELNGSAKR